MSDTSITNPNPSTNQIDNSNANITNSTTGQTGYQVPGATVPQGWQLSTPSSIPSDTLGKGGSNPVVVPPPTVSTSNPPTVPPPNGTTLDANGNATLPTPTKDTSPTDTQSWVKQQLMNGYQALTGKAAATTDAQNAVDLSGKTQQATTDYNAYKSAELALKQKIDQMQSQNAQGKFGSDVSGDIARVQREGNANLANLAVVAQSSQGLLDAAQKTITDKINAQFQPIQDNIDFLTKFNQVNNNDLTDSQKEQMQLKINQLTTDKAAVQTAASDIHQTLQKNNAPASVYDAIDAINHNYINGKIDADTAQTQMYATASKFTSGIQSTTYVPGANPIVDGYVAAIANGSGTLQNAPAGSMRNAVVVAMNSMPSTMFTPTAGRKFALTASAITKPFTEMPAYALTAGGGVYLDRINAAMQTPGSVSDQDLLDSLTKLNTGGNAISDAQVRLVTDGKSFADSVNVFQNKLKNGGVLSDSQRQQLSTIAKNIFANYQKSYAPIYKQASAQLTAAGIPKAFWTIPDLNTLHANIQDDTTTSQITPDNTKITGLTVSLPNGQTWTAPSLDALNMFKKDNGLQ